MTSAPAETTEPVNGLEKKLADIPPFQELPEAVLSLLRAQSEDRTYATGETVFSFGQYDGAEFVVVLAGALRVSATDGDTGAMLIEEVGEGGVFGLEIALAEPESSVFQHISVTAETDCRLIFIDASEFKKLASARPSLMRNIAMYLSSALVMRRFAPQSPDSAPERRIYSVLLECVARDPLSGAWRIERMPKHRELADRAGVDETAAASAVAALIQEGVAQRDYPGLIVNDMGRLNQLAQ